MATLKRSFRVLCFLYQNHCLVICLILLLEKISFQLFDKKAKILFFQFFGRRLEMFVMIVINSKILGYCGFNRKKSLCGFLGWWLEYILFVDNELHSIVWKKKFHEKTWENMQKSSSEVVFPSNLLHQVLFFLPNAKKRSTQLSVLRSFAHLPRVTV